jgi:hypothetical protein
MAARAVKVAIPRRKNAARFGEGAAKTSTELNT